jgi:hypothetical protein
MLGLSVVEDPKLGLQSPETFVREVFYIVSCFWGSVQNIYGGFDFQGSVQLDLGQGGEAVYGSFI